ncbi:sensor histidine kinase [Paracoccus caeni]|nr:ATP-binding protein [Paracoccus caeni]
MTGIAQDGVTDTQAGSRRLPAVLRVLTLLLAVVFLAGLFWLVRATGIEGIRAESTTAASLRVQALESVLAKQRAVAAVLADDDTVRTALRTGSSAALQSVSQKLERLHRETQSSVIYMLDLTGTAVAASNWDEPVSFVGQDYSFREYFGVALRDGQAREYALGTMSNQPGLYLSSRVDGPEGTLGVVVVKVEFDPFEASWARSPDDTLVTAADATVVLTSAPEFRFQPLPALPLDQIEVREPVPGADWMLLLRTSKSSATEAAAVATVAVAAGMLVVALWLSRARQARRRRLERDENERRYRIDLEHAVALRTHELSDEMRERRVAEQRLASMQADLVQANKLATLGQVTAGVAHEVNQPLATIRLLTENARALLPATTDADVRDNLAKIVQMTDRISQITTELRGFSRKATGRLEPVGLAEVLEASLLLTASRRRADSGQMVQTAIPPGLKVMAEAVRLEQILVNLIQNAQEVLTDRPDPRIRIAAERRGDLVEITVADNGPGLRPEIWSNLFIPFSTSKPDGLGLGLVISQDIARDFGGELTAEPPVEGQGATFRLILKAAE